MLYMIEIQDASFDPYTTYLYLSNLKWSFSFFKVAIVCIVSFNIGKKYEGITFSRFCG